MTNKRKLTHECPFVASASSDEQAWHRASKKSNYPVTFSCARRCVLTLLRGKLRVMLRATPCMMLCVMLCVMVPLAHDAVQPLSPNLSCPFLLSTSLVHICVQLGCTRRQAVLVAEVYLAYYFCARNLRFRAGDGEAHFAYHFCAEKLRCCSQSSVNASRVLLS